MLIPANPLLYNSISRAQRAQHHAFRGTNFAAAKGTETEYARQGGQYVSSMSEVDPKFRDVKQEAIDAEKRKASELKRKKKKKNLL